MASKYEIITALYRESVKGLAKNHHTWTAFLHSACYNYRLPFDEQVLIHAQRPDATAVLEIEGKNGWNQKFGRWVNRYATGIAVFDRNHAGRQRLKYYFDISDTHESRFARPVPIWEYKPEYEAAIIEALENRFGELKDKSDLQSALHSVAKNAVEDNLPDYLSELIRYRADSFLEDYDDLNVEVIYRRLLENSVAYMLMSRCGLDVDEYFEVDDFNDVINFNSPDTMNTLGVSTSDIAENCLGAIALTVRNLQREEKKENRTFADNAEKEYPIISKPKNTSERSIEDGTDLHDEERLSSAEPVTPARTGGSPWEIRIASQKVSATEPQGAIHQSADIGQTERALDGSGQGGKREEGKEERTTQLVFCDLSTPKGDGSFNVYDDLKQKLMERGIPEEEIAFIHDANTDARKKELFAKVRSGQVRILMGSTPKMGAGTNVQDRLVALHDLDCPWRPSDLAQRLGRIVRQGNRNKKVDIFRYVTEGTFDAYLYQLVENKQKFIAQIMTSKAPVRIASDVDETALNYAEIKALATGNPLIIEKCTLDMEVSKLNMLKASYLNQKYALEELVLRKYPADMSEVRERIAGYEKDLEIARAHPKPEDGFTGMIIMGVTHTEKETAGKAIIDACTRMTDPDAIPLGEYRGFAMTLSYDGKANEYRITLKGALSHTVVLGSDIYGNITRMDNRIDGIEEQLQVLNEKLADIQTQLENARTEMEAPFAREAELAEKTRRLQELNVLLNLDAKDKTLIADEPDESDKVTPRKNEYVR